MNRLNRVAFLLLFSACHSVGKIDHVETRNYPLNTGEYTSVDSSIYKEILPYKSKVDEAMDAVLATSDMAFEKKMPEGTLGNFAADACLQESQKLYYPSDNIPISFCFLNNGGLRASLPKGKITKRNVFELMPFENELAVLTLSGENTKKLIDFIVAKGGMPVSGISIKIKDSTNASTSIGNEAFDKNKNYKVVTSDYLANGGDNLLFLKDATNKEVIGLKVRDAIINYLQRLNAEGKTIHSQIEGRISYEQ